jgi:hypothetical protein
MARNTQAVKHSARKNLRAVNGANYLVWGAGLEYLGIEHEG